MDASHKHGVKSTAVYSAAPFHKSDSGHFKYIKRNLQKKQNGRSGLDRDIAKLDKQDRYLQSRLAKFNVDDLAAGKVDLDQLEQTILEHKKITEQIMQKEKKAATLERVLFKWKRFDGRGFSCQPGEHRSMMWTSCEDFDAAGAEKIAKPVKIKILNSFMNRNRLKLGSLRPGRRRAKLVAVRPAHFTLLARTQITGAQTIPIKQETL